MSDLYVRSVSPSGATAVSNRFLDEFMPRASGEFVKVYLCLLRIRGEDPSAAVSPAAIADRLAFTEQDVIRALRYWEGEGLLALGDHAGPEAAAQPKESMRPQTVSSERMKELSGMQEFQELRFAAEQYLGKMLSYSEMQKLSCYYDELHFSADLIEYLIEYCAEHGHTSFRYIDRVALNWFNSGIRTREEAKASTALYRKDYYEIMNMLGLTGRSPAEAEINLMKKWLDTYGMPMDLIREAAERTIMQTSGPNLKYMDSILESWQSSGVRSPADIAVLDTAHENRKKKNEKAASRKGNAWQGLPQRDYDFDEMEAALTGK